jgi:glycosyltransferase involved in cell wall biosynthesis
VVPFFFISFGRVAAEALLNGIPVLASRRGALPEALAEAGFLFDIPERYTPQTRLVPSAAEVAPWVETIVRLWDDAALYETERQRCVHAAEAWRPEKLAAAYEAFFARVLAPR